MHIRHKHNVCFVIFVHFVASMVKSFYEDRNLERKFDQAQA